MHALTTHEMTIFLITIGSMLILSRIISHIGFRLNLPTLVAEVLAGILLGPTVLGYFFPEFHIVFFPETGGLPHAYDMLFNLSVVLLLFLAGMDLDFTLLSKAVKPIVMTSLFGIFLPFSVGLFFGWRFSAFFHGSQFSIAPFIFPLTFGTILALSSLPIIARILMNNHMMHTAEGITILGTACVTDLVGWFGFSSIVVYANPIVENINILYTLLYIVVFFVTAYILSGNRWITQTVMVNKEKGEKPFSYDISMLIGLCLLFGAFTNAINIHPSLGAFIAGIAAKRIIGDNKVIFEHLELFILSFFAPIFFISIGLKINFIQNLNLPMLIAVFFLAATTKLVGATLGAYLGGFKFKHALVIGVGLNGRGSMEILMGAVALKLGLIYPQLFVTFVIVAITASLIAEPALIWLRKKTKMTHSDN